jgi:signal transduction histidine kinase
MMETLRELSHLRIAVVELCREDGLELHDETPLLHAAIDEGMATAAVMMEQAAVKELHQEAVFRDRFMGILGHDLRNPLASITFGAAALLKRVDRPPGEVKTLTRIVSSAERMEGMIHALLDLTRLHGGGGIPLEPKPIDLSAIVQQVVEELEATHTDREIRLDTRGDLAGTWDPDRLAQVVSNLLCNALDYSPPDTPVHISAEDHGADVVVRVKNLGPPIPPEILPVLFDPFRRGGSAPAGRASRGLGLGLYITQHIVQAHGGTIEATSTAEAGTNFIVHLPRAR